MPKPRYAQVSFEATPWYYCFSRCVRRAFLCGLDGLTQTSYEHRKQWLEDRVSYCECLVKAFKHVHFFAHANLTVLLAAYSSISFTINAVDFE